MNTITLTFDVNGQNIENTSPKLCMASDTVNYVEATFHLGDNWDGFDSVRAVWSNGRDTYATVLDMNGTCKAPTELLTVKSVVKVNLVGSNVVEDELVDRLTTYQSVALNIAKKVPIEGEETDPVTPSQFEQYIAIVGAEVEKVTGMSAEATTLPAGSDATASYEDGVLSFGIPKGDTGATGPKGDPGQDGQDGVGIASVALNSDYTLTITLTDGTTYTTTSIRGEQGIQGPTGPQGATGPQGPQGIQGETGEQGETGLTPDFSIGTVTTLAPGSQATATITGTDEEPVLNLGIPKGDPGEVTEAELLKLAVHDEASGSIASFADGSDGFPMDSLKVTLEPKQAGSGDPSPDNVRPITGWDEVNTVVCGKNLLDRSMFQTFPVTFNGITANLENDGTISLSGTATATSYVNIIDYVYLCEFDWLKPNTQYKMFGYADSDCYLIFGVYGTGTDYRDSSGSGAPFTFTENDIASKRYRLTIYVNNGKNVNGITIKPMICMASSDATYEPYQCRTITTTLPQTVYGGTLDVVTGELVVDRVSVDMGNLNWSLLSSSRFWVMPNGMKPFTHNISSSQYVEKNVGIGSLNTGEMTTQAESGEVYVKDERFTTATDFKSAVAGQQLCYELATPQTYQLTPTEIDTILGTNNVWSDVGNVYVKYIADTKLYILKVVQ